jgi:DNA-binding response OmpR family regulator
VVLVTAYGDDERRRMANELGAAAFLPKPIDFNQLKKKVAALAPQ